MMLAQPGHAAPVADQKWAGMAGRLFPALTALQRSGEAKTFAALPVLSERRRRIDACKQGADCVARAGLWSATEIAGLAALADHALKGPARNAAAADDGPGAQVSRELKGLNVILQVYGLGLPPKYPQIDGPIDPAAGAMFNAAVADALVLAHSGLADESAALDPSIAMALALLDVNDRGEASAFEPLDAKYNGAALAHARNIDWRRYSYTAIIVPGVGPENVGLDLSARSKLNVRMAAQRFADGAAPFIIVSGGAVHPRQSPYVEAMEMRTALIERFGVPPEAIVIEPYARHTTTNLRNVTRRLVALGAPLDHDTLIVTNVDQSRYIESAMFAERNSVELGYQPGKVGARVSSTDLTFRPAAVSLRVDPADPLDP